MKCINFGCRDERVSGSEYCDNHLLERQVHLNQMRTAAPVAGGTLADLIRKAKADGQIAPLITVTEGSGYQKMA